MTTVTHYSAESARTSVFHYAFRVLDFPATAIRRRSLLWNFFRRELFGRFRGSLLGIFWVLVQPIFLFCVYFAIFGILFGPRDNPTAGPNAAFALYLFAGILSFSAINESTNNGLTAIVGNSNLVKKVKFPCELLPLVPVLVSTVVYVVGCIVLVIAGLVTGEVHITWKLLWWPLLVVMQVMFATGFALMLAAANVFVRDISHLYRVFVTAWFFLTPNFWRFELVNAKFSAVGASWVSDLLMFNPAMPISLAQRQVFGIGDDLPPQATLPAGVTTGSYESTFPLSLTENLLLSAAWATGFLVLGYGFFKSRRHKFADLV